MSWCKTVLREFKVFTMSITSSILNECCAVGSCRVVWTLSTRLDVSNNLTNSRSDGEAAVESDEVMEGAIAGHV